MNEDVGGTPMPPARHAALWRIMLEDGVPEDQVEAAIARHQAAGMTIMVPSAEELRAMQTGGEPS